MAQVFSLELPDVFITGELRRRPIYPVDQALQKRAVKELVAQMTGSPEEVLPRFVDLAMELTGAASAGLSLLECGPSANRFRWRYVRGTLSPFEGSVTPRDFSPCGVTLDANGPTLCAYPERYYGWIAEAAITVPEVLLLPLKLRDGEPLGTLWIVSEQEGHFSRSHVDAVSDLVWFVGVALQMVSTQHQLRVALEDQQTLAKEMGHRVKNLIGIIDGMIRMGAHSTKSVDEFASTLSGRLQALASAHALVSRNLDVDKKEARAADLESVVLAVLAPHTSAIGSACAIVAGPLVKCGDKSINGLALVLHELATNASKYGALSTSKGIVQVTWNISAESLQVYWCERDGPAVEQYPETGGFGSKLVEKIVTGQFGGKIAYDWRPTGLQVAMRLQMTHIAA